MILRRSSAFLLLVISTLINQVALAKSDHPLLPAYPGAQIRSYINLEYERINIPVATTPENAANNSATTKNYVGDITRHFYMIKNASTLKVFENYQTALKTAGFNIQWVCKNDECGTAKLVKDIGKNMSIEGSVYNYYGNPYYLLAETNGANGLITVALFIGGYSNETAIQQIVVEETPLNDQLIQIDTTYLKASKPEEVQTITQAQLAEDHPLISRYPGAKVRNKQKADYESIELPFSSAVEQTDFGAQRLTGDLTRHFYNIKNTSSLKVFRNYQKALSALGFQAVYQCELEQCGDKKQAAKLGGMLSIENSVYNYYGNPYFIVAEKNNGPQKVSIFLFVGGFNDEVSVQQVVVESEELIDNMITIDAEGLNQQLEQLGKVLIYGIHFDIDKATIKPESKPTLDEIAKLLSINKALLLYVVGHTDDTGSLDHNTQLSIARATAVKNALIKDYGVSSSRLIARGVGPFAPEANNTSSAGKQKNRRVELVRRLK